MKKTISVYHDQIGQNIQAFRKHHQLSIKDLSQRCGIDVQQLQRMERGEVNFRLTTLVKVLQVTGNVLFYQITEEKNSFP
ncbi:MAG: Helix-turn-helix domain [Bacteroidota bacterium]|jgi:transcriptional regulator with XRE-family HTH domain